MTTKELDESVGVEPIKAFYKQSLSILERWMRVMCEEEGDMVSALVVDQLFKNMLIKMDTVFAHKETQVDDELQEFTNKLEVMKESCREKLDLQLEMFERENKKKLDEIA